MHYGHSQQAGDEGMAAIHQLVSRRIKWIFRFVSGPDFGIDAIVEQVGGGNATARWLSLQIKSGVSYFRETTDQGVVFRDTLEHLQYYRSHQLPVVVVLHDPATDEAIWQAVEPHAIELVEGWKLVIPFVQKIDERTGPAWSRLLSGRERPTGLKSEIRLINGSLVTVHDLLTETDDELLVAVPFISVEFLALLDFLASRIRIRVLTNETVLENPMLVGRSSRPNLEMRILPKFHSRFLIVDRETLCITSANFTHRGLSTAREVLAIDTEESRIHSAIDQFEQLWQEAATGFF